MSRIVLTWAMACFVWLILSPGVRAAGHPPPTRADAPSVAFYYGPQAPVDLLSQFDRVVVDAGHVDAARLAALRQHGARVYAYVSVGERDPGRAGMVTLSAADILGDNKAWHSQVVDLRSDAWRHYLLDQLITRLWKQGYRGLFLDTLDSYQGQLRTPAAARQQQVALASLIQAIHARFPGIHLLLNRGFKVLPEVHALVDGVVAESLFRGWNQAEGRYVEVSADDRAWLLKRLRQARDSYHLPVAVIDYLPPAKRDQARQIARKIAALGFAPWVGNAALDEVGVGSIEVVPRKVLMLYQKDNLSDPDDDISNNPINSAAAMPLEYLGYVPVYHEMHQPLPQGTLRGRYAGIVTWFSGQVVNPAQYRKWLLRQMRDGVPVAMLGNPGLQLNGRLLDRMGLRAPGELDRRSLRVAEHDAMLGFEGMPATVPPDEAGWLPGRKDVKAHLRLCDKNAHCLAPVLTESWGGLALAPWVIESAPFVTDVGPGENFFGTQQRWLLDPFAFYRKALGMTPMPMLDATTENGNRIASSHIDGDGFANRANLPGSPFAGKVIRDRILKHYDFPVTVSVIEGEVGPEGLFPKLSPQLETIARSIFRLPNVELATHTYSHPLDWLKIEPGMVSGKHNLPIPGYRFSFKRDIDGSIEYINRRLAPPGKKVKVVLWSGDAIPPLAAMQRVHALGLLEMNGGNTQITRRYDSLTNVSPMTRPVGPYYQVYAPDMNEEIYTNGYHGPFWGFEQVIETFKLTDMPRRLKPMSIYYHFFSGTHIAAIHALEKVYRYVMGQQILPMFESTYSTVVANYRHVGMARTLDGQWLIQGATEDRTVRVPDGQWPDLALSQGVVGVRDLPQGRYVALSGAGKVHLVLRTQPPGQPYLLRANGRVVAWQKLGRGFRLRLAGDVPLRMVLAEVGKGCRVQADGATPKRMADGHLLLDFHARHAGEVSVVCR